MVDWSIPQWVLVIGCSSMQQEKMPVLFKKANKDEIREN
jgi:hypothetical protein